MKALVTGGTGFTGSHLVRRLLQEGWEVVALDYKPGLFADDLESEGAEVILDSITEPGVVDDATRGTDVVFHLAAAFRDLTALASTYRKVNVDGTRNVLNAACEWGVSKVVYCSTQGVHGNVDNPPGDENTPIDPEDLYQETKYEGELVCHEYIDGDQMDVTIIRPTAIYGPGDPGRFLMLFKMAETGHFLMFGDGTTTYHPIYIDNLVDLFLLTAEDPRSSGETYIGADEKYYSLDDLVTAVGRAIDVDVNIWHLPFWPMWTISAAVEAICKPLGISPPLFRRRADWYRQVRAFRIDKAKEDLGFRPRIGLDEGLRRTANWYRRNGYL